MKVPKPRLFILLPLLVFLPGCFVSKMDSDESHVTFARKNAGMIKEMAEYAVLFCETNKLHSFAAGQVANKAVRKKISRLGNEITVFYNGYEVTTDSVVTFKYITLLHGVQEYAYDFSLVPKNIGDQRQPGETLRRQVTERIYYIRRPFPIM